MKLNEALEKIGHRVERLIEREVLFLEFLGWDDRIHLDCANKARSAAHDLQSLKMLLGLLSKLIEKEQGK